MRNEIFLPEIVDSEGTSLPLANCIRKNYLHIREWAICSSTNSFRIYDREIQKYPLIIDFYAGKFCIQYFSPVRESCEPPIELVEEVQKALYATFGSQFGSMYWKTRAKKKETRQYEKIALSKDFFVVQEYGVKFKVNLQDYLDTGLFLDHRDTRQMVAAVANGKRVLNLFAYTGSFSVQAAMAGSSSTKSVDMSNTYTAWAKDNFHLNSLSLNNNEVIREDCLQFLDKEVLNRAKYDIIIIDPPTISRSKKMLQLFDIQVDYIALISKSLKILANNGIIFFSTNSRKFTFDSQNFKSCSVLEISNKTIPLDFHDSNIHRCWKISTIFDK